MTPFRACGIVEGSFQWSDPREYLEACLYVSIHPTQIQGLIGPAYITIAKHVADFAVDNGEDAACDLIRKVKAEATAKLPQTDLTKLAELKGWKKPL